MFGNKTDQNKTNQEIDWKRTFKSPLDLLKNIQIEFPANNMTGHVGFTIVMT